MKKYLYVILAFVVIFTAAPFLLTACGKPGNDGSKDPEITQMQPMKCRSIPRSAARVPT